MRKILEGNREKGRGEGLMFECWNVGIKIGNNLDN